MIISCAEEKDYAMVRRFYHHLIDRMRNGRFRIGWEKDIYPSPGFLRHSLVKGELYIAEEGDEIIAAMVCNQECNEGYRKHRWRNDLSDSEILVIHALGVRPDSAMQGLGGLMVRKAKELAREKGRRAIRLDVLKGNLPAERLYTGAGFTHAGDLRMYYEDTGWTDFGLYEYLLPEDGPEEESC